MLGDIQNIDLLDRQIINVGGILHMDKINGNKEVKGDNVGGDKITISGNSGQVNFAKDNAIINATMNVDNSGENIKDVDVKKLYKKGAKIIKVFVASSKELEEDRKDFEIFIGRKNKQLIKDNKFIELVMWEDFIEHMSQTRLQDEYNKAIKECDIFIMLFCTKVGKYTEEEFEKAFKSFKENNKPLVYTYFKEGNVNLGNISRDDMNSLWAFQDKLRKLEHFTSKYKNFSDLEAKFISQLEKLSGQLFSENE